MKKVWRCINGVIFPVQVLVDAPPAQLSQAPQKAAKPKATSIQKSQSSSRSSPGRQSSVQIGHGDKRASRMTIWGHR
jgi:hypothetical protein